MELLYYGHPPFRRCLILYEELEQAEGGIGFDPESAFAWLNDESLVPVTRVYLGIKDDPENSILVWEKGMEVRAATAEEEALYTNR